MTDAKTLLSDRNTVNVFFLIVPYNLLWAETEETDSD